MLRSKYMSGNEVIGLDSKVTEKDRRVWQLVDRGQYGLHVLEDGKVYKIVKVKMDLSCVCRVESTLGEILESLYLDFERSFLCRSESDHEVLPKRVLIARNGLEIGLYLDRDAELQVG